MRIVLLALALAVLPGCLTPHPANGAITCSTTHACPNNYVCQAPSNTCWAKGTGPESGGNDMSVTGASCSDRSQDGDETDTDCGGSCPACLVGKMCAKGTDCVSMNCDPSSHLCASPQCQDGTQDGKESDKDCGGGTCPLCDDGKMCKSSSDCSSALCSSAGVCITGCQNGSKDGNETDVDCGGVCSACAGMKACLVDADCLGGACKSNLCVPASGPPSWVTVADIPKPRGGVAAATGSDGRVWVLGGVTSSSQPTTQVDIYNPSNNTWDPNPPQLPSARFNLMAASNAGVIYAIGGTTPAVGGGSQTSATYFTQWIDNGITNLPLAVDSAGAAVGPDSRIYVAGGEVGNGNVGNYGTVTQVYDPAVNTWSQLPLLSVIHGGPGAAFGSDGHLYVVGGGDVEGSFITNIVEMFDAAQNKWVEKAPISQARLYLGSLAAPDGRIYAIGGYTGVASVTLCEAYTPGADFWVKAAPLKVANSNMAVALSLDGRMFVLGGATATTQAYGPSVTLAPTSVSKGQTASVNGNNFAASATVTITLDGTPVATGTTDAFGGMTAAITFTVPNVGSGPHVVKVVDNKSVYPISLTLTVN